MYIYIYSLKFICIYVIDIDQLTLSLTPPTHELKLYSRRMVHFGEVDRVRPRDTATQSSRPIQDDKYRKAPFYNYLYFITVFVPSLGGGSDGDTRCPDDGSCFSRKWCLKNKVNFWLSRGSLRMDDHTAWPVRHSCGGDQCICVCVYLCMAVWWPSANHTISTFVKLEESICGDC